jgi:hypothetical protein
MSETNVTTHNIERITSPLQILLTEGSSYPYDLSSNSISRISISNNTSTEITIVLTDISTVERSIRLTANKNFESPVTQLSSINTSAITSFDIALFGGA